MKISERLGHVVGIEEYVEEESEGEGEERIPECSQSTLSNSSCAKELVKIFLSNFVRIFTGLAKVVDQT